MVVTFGVAWAGDDEVVVEGDALPVDAGSAQVTVIEVAALPPSAELADAIERAPGVVVRRLGGVGDLAQVGIRGASARQSEVLLDGLPLNPEGGSAVNLAEWPVRAFERVEVYRGAAPALLGTTALGGAIALIPSRRPLSEITLAGGSFGTRRASGTAGVDTRAGYLLANVDGLWTDGTFRYWDDRGTAFTPGDDRVETRVNNDTAQGSGLVEWRVDAGRSEWVGLYAGLVRDEGVPGFTFAPSATVRYGVRRHLGGVRFTVPAGAVELGGRAFALTRAEALSDPLGEIGVGAQQTDDHTTSFGSDATARAPVASAARIDVGLGARLDRFRSDVDAERWVGKGVVAVPIGDPTRGIEPMVQVLAVSDQPVRVLPRVGATARTGRVGWRANVGGFARPPDLVELYGDRGALVGNPALRAARGVQADVGGRASGVDAVAFVAGYRDLIAWTVGAQGVARPENVDRADVFGVELAVEGGSGPWRVGGSATATRAVDRSSDAAYAGNQLPRVPGIEASARVGRHGRWWGAGVDGSFAAATFADRANLVPQPERLFVGASAEVRPTRSLALSVDVRNALDTISARVPADPLAAEPVWTRAAVVDFGGYPLPGRALTVAVTWGDR